MFNIQNLRAESVGIKVEADDIINLFTLLGIKKRIPVVLPTEEEIDNYENNHPEMLKFRDLVQKSQKNNEMSLNCPSPIIPTNFEKLACETIENLNYGIDLTVVKNETDSKKHYLSNSSDFAINDNKKVKQQEEEEGEEKEKEKKEDEGITVVLPHKEEKNHIVKFRGLVQKKNELYLNCPSLIMPTSLEKFACETIENLNHGLDLTAVKNETYTRNHYYTSNSAFTISNKQLAEQVKIQKIYKNEKEDEEEEDEKEKEENVFVKLRTYSPFNTSFSLKKKIELESEFIDNPFKLFVKCGWLKHEDVLQFSTNWGMRFGTVNVTDNDVFVCDNLMPIYKIRKVSCWNILVVQHERHVGPYKWDDTFVPTDHLLLENVTIVSLCNVTLMYLWSEYVEYINKQTPEEPMKSRNEIMHQFMSVTKVCAIPNAEKLTPQLQFSSAVFNMKLKIERQQQIIEDFEKTLLAVCFSELNSSPKITLPTAELNSKFSLKFIEFCKTDCYKNEVIELISNIVSRLRSSQD